MVFVVLFVVVYIPESIGFVIGVYDVSLSSRFLRRLCSSTSLSSCIIALYFTTLLSELESGEAIELVGVCCASKVRDGVGRRSKETRKDSGRARERDRCVMRDGSGNRGDFKVKIGQNDFTEDSPLHSQFTRVTVTVRVRTCQSHTNHDLERWRRVPS